MDNFLEASLSAHQERNKTSAVEAIFVQHLSLPHKIFYFSLQMMVAEGDG